MINKLGDQTIVFNNGPKIIGNYSVAEGFHPTAGAVPGRHRRQQHP